MVTLPVGQPGITGQEGTEAVPRNVPDDTGQIAQDSGQLTCDDVPMSQTTAPMSARAVAGFVAALAVVMGASAIALDVVADASGLLTPVAPGWTGAGPGLLLAATGAILMWRMGWHPIAMILLGFGALYTLGGLASAWVNHAVALWADAPLVEVAFLINQRFSGLATLAIPFVLLVFPNGRLPSPPAWRAVAVTSGLLCALAPILLIVMPWPELHARFGRPDPSVWSLHQREWGIPLPAGVWETASAVVMPALVIGVLLSAVVLFGRRIGADAELRHQLKWIVWAGLIFSALFILGITVMPYYVGQAGFIVGTGVVCTAILIAVTRFRLYSIDSLLSWTVLYGALTVAVIIVDVVLIALVGGLIGDQALAIASVVLVFVVYAPLRERMLGWAARLVNGRRGDPYGVVSSLAGRLEEATDPDDQLAHVARSIALAFASPYVLVQVDQPDGRHLIATHGWTSGATIPMPLSYRGERIGRLEMAPGRRAHLTHRDEQLLADVVRQAAAAVRATALSRELQQIREQLVTAREEERHRLRRDLHDGLGPALAAVQLRVEAARNVSADDPARSDALLATAVTGITEAVADIRRLAHDLRPPAIDDLGLVGAVQQLCERFDADAGGGLRVRLRHDVPERVPAAVEVAVYRIVSEALMNVQRHADANEAAVELFQDGEELVVEVADDGVGVSVEAHAGVGMQSMRERAAELGGGLGVIERVGGGTVLRATLPLPVAAREEVLGV